ncbi:MAG: hypothetical protein AAF939_21005, partial [Planctomycetota bacterium]
EADTIQRSKRQFRRTFRVGYPSDLEHPRAIKGTQAPAFGCELVDEILFPDIATLSNREDEVTGHFWQSRISSEVLKTETSLVNCMIYVDLNPVRAGIAESNNQPPRVSKRPV